MVARVDPSGRHLAYAKRGDNTLYIADFNSEDLHVLASRAYHSKPINDIQFSPVFSDIFATAGEDHAVVIWKVVETNGELSVIPRRRLLGHRGPVSTLRFNEDSTVLLSGGVDERAILWDVKTGFMMKNIYGHSQPVSSIDISYDGTVAATAGLDGNLRLWDLVNWRCIDSIQLYPKGEYIVYVSLSPNSEYLITLGSSGWLKLLDWADGTILRGLETNAQNSEIREVLPLNNTLLAMSSDEGVYLVDIEEGKVLDKITEMAVNTLSYVADRDLLVLSDFNNVQVIHLNLQK